MILTRSLTSQELKQLCDMVKFTEYTKSFLQYWDKKLTRDQVKRIKSAYTNYSKAWDAIVKSMDSKDNTRLCYTIANTHVAVLPKKEMNEAIKRVMADTDGVLMDFAFVNCDPCRHDPKTCLLRKHLKECNYPGVDEQLKCEYCLSY